VPTAAEVIRWVRTQKLGLSQESFSRKVGKSKAWADSVERGRSHLPHPDTRTRLARLVGVADWEALVRAYEYEKKSSGMTVRLDVPVFSEPPNLEVVGRGEPRMLVPAAARWVQAPAPGIAREDTYAVSQGVSVVVPFEAVKHLHVAKSLRMPTRRSA